MQVEADALKVVENRKREQARMARHLHHKAEIAATALNLALTNDAIEKLTGPKLK